MDTLYQLQNIEFEWNNNKAESNLEKHGVTFEEATEVFLDPFCKEGDASSETGERDFIIGYSIAQRLLLLPSRSKSIENAIVTK